MVECVLVDISFGSSLVWFGLALFLINGVYPKFAKFTFVLDLSADMIDR